MGYSEINLYLVEQGGHRKCLIRSVFFAGNTAEKMSYLLRYLPV